MPSEFSGAVICSESCNKMRVPRRLLFHQNVLIPEIMNLRRKSRCKLKIFGSFGGSKSRPRQFRSEADLTSGGDKSVPVLLGIKHNNEDFGSIQHLDRIMDRHRWVTTKANNARQLNFQLISVYRSSEALS